MEGAWANATLWCYFHNLALKFCHAYMDLGFSKDDKKQKTDIDYKIGTSLKC